MAETPEGKAFKAAVDGPRRPCPSMTVISTAAVQVGTCEPCPCGCGRRESVIVRTQGGWVHLESRAEVEAFVAMVRSRADLLWGPEDVGPPTGGGSATDEHG